MRYAFLVLVFVVNGCTMVSDFDGYTFGRGAVDVAGAGGAAGMYWWTGAGGAAGTAGAGGAAGEDPRWAGAGGGIWAGAGGAAGELEDPDAGPEPEDTAEPLQDAQEPVPDAGEPEDGGSDAGPAADAGEALGTQCELCAVKGEDGLFEDVLQCEEGYLCNELVAGAAEAYCLQRTFPGTPRETECGEGLYEWPESTLLGIPRCRPVSGSCEQWLQEYGQ